ncbi:hypothetical protein KSMBR1_3104 [Candidatus Kuenenia stuttgartiensis]|jgi:hypothetical protein|uniref:Uncharacterized protein n=1 Tax=Kuenenia stuttgartiensis TaxID=174633 RepID=A0A2C9CIN8_KUEST|nr:hypothetical protein KSMBR1_3104 [Candidatus Kuenenia stuttgartiensis]
MEVARIERMVENKIYNLNPANKAKPCCRNRIEMVGFPRYSAVY